MNELPEKEKHALIIAERIANKYQCTEVMRFKGKIKMKRKDGLVIYLDRIRKDDPDRDMLVYLNKVRLTMPVVLLTIKGN